MLSKLLRIGPLVLMQTITMVLGVMLGIVYEQRCWSLTLIQCSLSIFVVEMIISYHLIHKSHKHRRIFLCRLAASTNSKLYSTLAWNQLILIVIMGLLAFDIYKDGSKLLGSTLLTDCNFSLYPLCLQYQYEAKQQKTQSFMVRLWLLYVFFSLFNILLLFIVQRKQYQYTLNIVKNRQQLAMEYLEDDQKLYESLIKSKVTSMEDFRGSCHQCAICLGDMAEGDLVSKLYCNHHFHSGCLQEWLQKRKQCPYRCQLTKNINPQ